MYEKEDAQDEGLSRLQVSHVAWGLALSLVSIICPLVTQIKGERKQANKVKLLGVNKPKFIGSIDCAP